MDKVVFCSSNPGRSAAVDRKKEYFAINANLNGPSTGQTVELIDLDSPTPQEFVMKLIVENPSILHLSGASSFDGDQDSDISVATNVQQSEGIYMWKEKGGEVIKIEQEKWEEIFQELHSLMSNFSTVVLSVFSSGGIAQTISRFNVDCIAFIDTFEPSLKIHFLNGFYFALANGRNVEDSFRIGRLSGIAISDDPAFKGKVALFRNGVRILV